MNKVAVFCGSSTGFDPIYKNDAKELGVFLAKNNIGLVYGGGKIGMMGVLADAVLANKGKVTGIIPKLLEKEEVIHPDISEIIVCRTMSERKVLMSKMADGYITLPGGFGTLDELFESLTLGQLYIEQKPVGLLNVNDFFDATIQQLDRMVEEGFLNPQNRKLLLIDTTINGLLEKMKMYQPPAQKAIINKVVS